MTWYHLHTIVLVWFSGENIRNMYCADVLVKFHFISLYRPCVKALYMRYAFYSTWHENIIIGMFHVREFRHVDLFSSPDVRLLFKYVFVLEDAGVEELASEVSSGFLESIGDSH